MLFPGEEQTRVSLKKATKYFMYLYIYTCQWQWNQADSEEDLVVGWAQLEDEEKQSEEEVWEQGGEASSEDEGGAEWDPNAAEWDSDTDSLPLTSIWLYIYMYFASYYNNDTTVHTRHELWQWLVCVGCGPVTD